MSYRFEAGRIYRMPTHFGPAPGPRQVPHDVAVDPQGNLYTTGSTDSTDFPTTPGAVQGCCW